MKSLIIRCNERNGYEQNHCQSFVFVFERSKKKKKEILDQKLLQEVLYSVWSIAKNCLES